MKNLYKDCNVKWNEKDLNDLKGDYKRKGKVRNNDEWDAYELLRRCWDGFFQLVPRQHQAIAMIRTTFINDEYCKKWRPFKNVKDYKGRSHFYVFNSYMDRLTEVLWSELYECFYTIEQVIYQSFVYASTQEGVKFTKTSFKKALTLYMFRLAEGVTAEPRVVREFNKQFIDTNYILELAENDFESFDIDAFLVNVKDGGVYPVSIKIMKALNYGTISKFQSMGKTKPIFYIGYTNKKTKKIIILDKNGVEVDLRLFKPVKMVNVLSLIEKKEEILNSKKNKKRIKTM